MSRREMWANDLAHLQYWPTSPDDSFQMWATILPVQLSRFFELRTKQTFATEPVRHIPLNDERSPHISLVSSSGIESDLFGLASNIYAEIEPIDGLSFSYVSPKGGAAPH